MQLRANSHFGTCARLEPVFRLRGFSISDFSSLLHVPSSHPQTLRSRCSSSRVLVFSEKYRREPCLVLMVAQVAFCLQALSGSSQRAAAKADLEVANCTSVFSQLLLGAPMPKRPAPDAFRARHAKPKTQGVYRESLVLGKIRRTC